MPQDEFLGWLNQCCFFPCLLSARQPHFHILVRIYLVTVFSWDKRYEISSVVVSIQLKSLRLSKHDEENDMTIGSRQGTRRGCGGKRTGKRWHMRRSYSLIWYGNNKKRALKETWRNTLFSKTMIFDIWRKLRVFFFYAHLYSLMPSDLISFGKQRWFNQLKYSQFQNWTRF